MSKKVLILSGSPRKGGNSDILCDEFLRGAREAGHQVEKVRPTEKKIAPCLGCYYCASHGGECVRRDDMADLLQQMIDADVIVLASPVYFYSINAQLKAVIDRTVARWLEVKNKELYYIVTMADECISSADTTLACFRGYAECVEGAVEKGVIISPFMGRSFPEYTYSDTTDFLAIRKRPVEIDGDAEMADYEKRSTTITAQVSARAESRITFPLFDYDGFRATVDGREIAVQRGSNNRVSVVLPAGTSGALKIWFAGKGWWRVGDAVSAATLIGLLFWMKEGEKKACRTH